MRFCICGHKESRHSAGMYGRGCGGQCSCYDFSYSEDNTIRNYPRNYKVAGLLNKYYQELKQLGIKAKSLEDQYEYPSVSAGAVALDFEKRLQHVMWMIEQMLETEATEWSMSKVNRWLGFIQGVLWATKKRGILQMRDESRHLYDSSENSVKYSDCWKPE